MGSAIGCFCIVGAAKSSSKGVMEAMLNLLLLDIHVKRGAGMAVHILEYSEIMQN